MDTTTKEKSSTEKYNIGRTFARSRAVPSMESESGFVAIESVRTAQKDGFDCVANSSDRA